MNISVSETAKQFPEIDELLSGHFHQDWAIVFDWNGQTPNRDAVVRFFIKSYPQEYVRKAKDQLEKFLLLPLSDNSLKKIMIDDFGVAYDPKYDGMTMREWLENVLRILQEKPNFRNTLKRADGTSPESIGLDLDALGFPRINQK